MTKFKPSVKMKVCITKHKLYLCSLLNLSLEITDVDPHISDKFIFIEDIYIKQNVYIICICICIYVFIL